MANVIGIDPTVDFACKLLLGSPDHPAITLHFLNAVIQPRVPIVDVKIVNPIVGAEYEEDKVSILDILARDASGRRFNIEVQRTAPPSLGSRLTFYVAGQLANQMEEGQTYRELRPVVGICILDAVFIRGIPEFHHQFRLRTAEGMELSDCLEIHILELPKYALPTDNEVIADPMEQWLYFFRQAASSTAEELTTKLPDPVFLEATGVLEMIVRSPEERLAYEARQKFLRDYRWQLEEGIAEAAERARSEGIERGLEQGRSEGIEQGELLGSIRAFRELLGLGATQADELQKMTVPQLQALAEELREQVKRRLS